MTRPAAALRDHDGGSPAFKIEKNPSTRARTTANGLHLLFAFFNKVRQTA